MNIGQILKILDASLLTSDALPQKKVESAYCADLMSDVLSFSVTRSLLITGLTNPQVIRTAEMAAIEMVVFIQDKKPDMQTIRLAEEKHIPLLSTSYSMFDTCGRLYENGLRSHAYAR
jgi:predicted transcriptional regulator